jgi:ATP adenylyltransferase/5',5'''-P-1,P-4-tetraphosphate phosphorylase II
MVNVVISQALLTTIRIKEARRLDSQAYNFLGTNYLTTIVARSRAPPKRGFLIVFYLLV